MNISLRFAAFVLISLLTFAWIGCSDAPPQESESAPPESREVAPDPQPIEGAINSISEREKAIGWSLLFDGKTMAGWHNYGKDGVSGWSIEDGAMVALGEEGGDIVSDLEFKDFELSLEWKISPEGNSGIFFRVIEDTSRFGAVYETGPEYQLLDDIGFPGKIEEWQKTGANYAMHLATSRPTKPVGEWNTTTMLVNGPHVEHWLNGEKIVTYELWSKDWLERKEKGKWKDYPKYGLAFTGHIGLQDHGNKTWFRNIKIRRF